MILFGAKMLTLILRITIRQATKIHDALWQRIGHRFPGTLDTIEVVILLDKR